MFTSAHVLLGLQVLFGSVLVLIGLYAIREAFSDRLSRSERDGAFASHLLGGMVALVVGSLLIFLVGFTSEVVLPPYGQPGTENGDDAKRHKD